jgi:hypothetical protein
MPIDLLTELIFPLGQAPERAGLPARRRGRKPAVSTFFRWAAKGVGGVRLEVIRVGNTLCTSREAVARFCVALTECLPADAAPTPAARPDLAAQRLAARWDPRARGRRASDSDSTGPKLP